jgi:hypothetical protein
MAVWGRLSVKILQAIGRLRAHEDTHADAAWMHRSAQAGGAFAVEIHGCSSFDVCPLLVHWAVPAHLVIGSSGRDQGGGLNGGRAIPDPRAPDQQPRAMRLLSARAVAHQLAQLRSPSCPCTCR